MSTVVVLGGGYAGLACLIALAKRDQSLELHLVDARPDHCKINNLHKTFQQPVEKFTVPYAQLAERFRFSFHHQRLPFSQETLTRSALQSRQEFSRERHQGCDGDSA